MAPGDPVVATRELTKNGKLAALDRLTSSVERAQILGLNQAFRKSTRVFWLLLGPAFVLLVLASNVHADDDVLDVLIYHNPELPKATITKQFPPDLFPLWLVALRQPEADYQSKAALTIALAHKEGMDGLEAAVQPLLEMLQRPEQQALVRLAIAQALVELDAKQAADHLFQQAQSGNHDLRDLIEPALARWAYQPARKAWLERLRMSDPPSGDLLLAIRGLAELREKEASSRLAELVNSGAVAKPIRLEAARALGVIQTSGLEADARRLASLISEPSRSRLSGKPEPKGDGSRAGLIGRLAAANLLRHHQGAEAVRLLETLAGDSESAVAALAVERLLEIDSKLVLPMIDQVLASPDAKVRSLGVDVLSREATVSRLDKLVDRLDDSHPDVRAKARRSLRDLAAKRQFHDSVIQQGLRVLAGKDWRGLEQATFLLAQLDHKPAAKRLVELLTFDRPEVFVAAAWGLRRLAVAETLPDALKHFQMVHHLARNPGATRAQGEGWDFQLSHLAQFMGQSRYQPAEAALRLKVPRFQAPLSEQGVGQESRAASIWALGLIHEGKPDPNLVRQLGERLNDIGRPFVPPEDSRVRWMCAITLGRMNSKDSLPSLRRFQSTAAHPTIDPVAHACSWAIHHLTGEAPPPPGSVGIPAGTFKNWLRSVRPEPKPAG
jgi:HEAT repeat protein